MKEERAVAEYRVWLETGDLIGCASLYKRRAWWTVEVSPFLTSDKTKAKGFRSETDARDYAMEMAELYMSQAIEWEKNAHIDMGCCEPVDNYKDAYSIQVTEADQ